MIAVIADDFTGAAEIGGLALSYGYTVAVVTELNNDIDVDVLVIATTLRSKGSKQAADEVKSITKQLLELNPEFIYKKIDSVLRGNVAAELEAQMEVSGKTRSLVIPANPILKRTIREGIYFVEDQKLMDSIFSKDDSFKTKSSKVVDIVKVDEKSEVHNISISDTLPKSGLLIGNTQDMSDLKDWASIVDQNTLPSGASGFFGAILEKSTKTKSKYDDKFSFDQKKILYVCGSNFPNSKQAVIAARDNGYSVSTMPDEIYNNQSFDINLVDEWAEEIILEFKSSNQVIISVLQQQGAKTIRGKQIKEVLGLLVQRVLQNVNLDELFIEGGSTAYVITQELKVNTFYPIQSLAPGVARMRVGKNKGMNLTVKPGSYVWPKSIWKFN